MPGTIIEIDPENREVDFAGIFAVIWESRIILARLASYEHRPKDGPRGLNLQPTSVGIGREILIPISADEFAQNCLGRLIGDCDSSAWARDTEAERLRRAKARQHMDKSYREAKEAEAVETRNREHAARDAGWRAPTVKATLPDWAKIPENPNLFAPEGEFPIDRVTRKLIRQGRLLYDHTDYFNSFTTVRSFAFSYAKVALDQAHIKVQQQPQHRRNAKAIAERLERMIHDMEGFLTHVDLDQAALFKRWLGISGQVG